MAEPASTPAANKPMRALLALLLTVPMPTIGLLCATYLLPDTLLGRALFGAAKLWIIVLPVLWLVRVEKTRPRLPRLSWAGMPAGIVTGVVIFTAILAAYLLVGHWIDIELVRGRIEAVGLDNLWFYLATAVYWCTLNSIIEEYVWRWFVFTRCEALMPRLIAVVAAGLFFTLHHIVALDFYFDWRVTVLASLGVFIGGTTWSWIYLKWRNIYAAYVSHVFADLAVFGIGWHLIFVSGSAAA